jgi:phosphopantothenoylcysteine decarboxylase / phosphopantothenate---cysteine ligase
MIILGVSASISVYKACEIIRRFQDRKETVQVIMTPNAARLIHPRLLKALTGRQVLVDLFDEGVSQNILHVELAKRSSLFLIAPATANVIGKMAGGVADDFLTTFYLAVKHPVAVAPAMNEKMYWHPAVQKNIQCLKSRGVHFIEPDRGYLACGESGWGRLASPEEIVETGLGMIAQSQSLHGKKVIVTAGPTREYMDPVRFISNRSSGKMGWEMAEEAFRRGAEVTLIYGPAGIYPSPEIEYIQVETGGEMAREIGVRLKETDILVMAAAVSDYGFSETSREKKKKSAEEPLPELTPAPDILKKLGDEKERIFLVGFAAETRDLEKYALEKMKSKNLDMIAANDVSRKETGFDSDWNQVTVFRRDGKKVEMPMESKREISRRIWDEIEDLYG